MTKTQFYKPYFQKVIWDYNLDKINLDKNEKLFCWFLERKINYDGLKGIKKSDLLKFYKKLDIDPAYKDLIATIDE